jgi:hypothetical protein
MFKKSLASALAAETLVVLDAGAQSVHWEQMAAT